MDLRTVVTTLTLFFITAESDSTLATNITGTPLPAQTNSTTSDCTCLNAASAATSATTSSPRSTASAIVLLTIRWMGKCKGDVNLILYPPSNSSPVCYSNLTSVHSLLRNVCKEQKGCKDTLHWDKGAVQNGYYITERGAEPRTNCETLKVQCTVEDLTDVQGQLQAYKVVTALLCCVLVVLLLIRITRPTVKALQKRLSNRRQNRWIGPTQSHSVSYHRGKTAVKNNDGEKRLSYPALERLAVIDSREPSSNRNSDYNF